MKIDYSIQQISKYCLLLDVPLRQGAKHIGLAIVGSEYGLSIAEKIKHVAIGILKCIPVLGHVIALIDTLCQRSITHIKLTSKNPFERGVEHGRILKKRIKEVYDPILSMKRNDPILIARIPQFEQQIPDNIKEEMRGLAQGSGYSYQDVLFIHSFLDAQPGQFGCTSMAVKETDGNCQRIVAANHSVKENDVKFLLDANSVSRRQAFLDHPISKNGSVQEVLQSAGQSDTIQAMVFDTSTGEIQLSSRATDAAKGKFRKFEPNLLFDSHQFGNSESNHRVRIFRNLDWPWYFLGQETVVITRPQSNGNSTVSISWPGYIGTLSGINSNGLALTGNQCGSEVNLNGIPNPLLFTAILDTCKNVSEASQMLEQRMHGSSMNLVIADKISTKSYELEGSGQLSCVGEIN